MIRRIKYALGLFDNSISEEEETTQEHILKALNFWFDKKKKDITKDNIKFMTTTKMRTLGTYWLMNSISLREFKISYCIRKFERSDSFQNVRERHWGEVFSSDNSLQTSLTSLALSHEAETSLSYQWKKSNVLKETWVLFIIYFRREYWIVLWSSLLSNPGALALLRPWKEKN